MSKHTELDRKIVEAVDSVGTIHHVNRLKGMLEAHPSVTEALLRRRLESLAKRGQIRKEKFYRANIWHSVNPETHRQIKAALTKREALAKRARSVVLAMGLATDPETIEVPPWPGEERCPACADHPGDDGRGGYCGACDGYALTPESRALVVAYEEVQKRRDDAERHLDHVCCGFDGSVTLTAEQFLSLAAAAKGAAA